MKTITARLDNTTEKALDSLLELGYSISDIINIAIITLEANPPPIKEPTTLYEKLNCNTQMVTWAIKNGFDINKVKYTCKMIEDGKTIKGFGNSINKYRDKNQPKFKTETSKIAWKLKEDFGIEYE